MRTPRPRFWLLALLSLILPACSSTCKPYDAHYRDDAARALDRFHELAARHPGPLEGSLRWSSASTTEPSRPHVVATCLLHGDEPSCLAPLLDVFDELAAGKLEFLGTYTLILGYPDATANGPRWRQQDLNRSFGEEAPDSFERGRAKAIMPVLESADLFIDIHETDGPTDEPFYTFSYRPLTQAWADYLRGARFAVTRSPDFLAPYHASSALEYAARHGVPALVYETNRKGMSNGERKPIAAVMRRALAGSSALGDTRDVAKVRALSGGTKPITLFKRAYVERFVHPGMRLREGLKNFYPVREGETVGHNEKGEPIVARRTGYLIFPKYPPRDERGECLPPVPVELFTMVIEVTPAEFL